MRRKKENKGVFAYFSEKRNTILLVLVSCLFMITFTFCSAKKGNPDRFKVGVFEIPTDENRVKEEIIRKDSIQISKYGNDVDTLSIKWKNNFFYTLKYVNPKTDLEKDPMFVQITKIKADSYDFTVKTGFSKFTRKATTYIR